MSVNEELIDQTVLNGERCPFCRKSNLKIIRRNEGFQINCNHCKCHTGVYQDIDTLIDIWNNFCRGSIKR